MASSTLKRPPINFVMLEGLFIVLLFLGAGLQSSHFSATSIFSMMIYIGVIGLIGIGIYGAIKIDPLNTSLLPHFYLLQSLAVIFLAIFLISVSGIQNGERVNGFLFLPSVLGLLGIAVYSMHASIKSIKRKSHPIKENMVNTGAGLSSINAQSLPLSEKLLARPESATYIGAERTGLLLALLIIIGGITGSVIYSNVPSISGLLLLSIVVPIIILAKLPKNTNHAVYIFFMFWCSMAIPLIGGIIMYVIIRARRLTR